MLSGPRERAGRGANENADNSPPRGLFAALDEKLASEIAEDNGNPNFNQVSPGLPALGWGAAQQFPDTTGYRVVVIRFEKGVCPARSLYRLAAAGVACRYNDRDMGKTLADPLHQVQAIGGAGQNQVGKNQINVGNAAEKAHRLPDPCRFQDMVAALHEMM
jgi:hypothetical protein